jgi:hypothetical protein
MVFGGLLGGSVLLVVLTTRGPPSVLPCSAARNSRHSLDGVRCSAGPAIREFALSTEIVVLAQEGYS